MKLGLGIRFWQFQLDYLKDCGRFVAIMWARGCGKSKITALKIVLDSFQNEIDLKPSDWLIVSATAPQAREALSHVATWAQLIYKIAVKIEIVEVDVELKTESGRERYTRFEVRLGKSTKIMALSASPTAIRGYTSNVWLDELCFFERDAEIFNAAQHCTRGRLKIIVSSTPLGGAERQFHKIMYNTAIVRGQKLWSTHTCDIHRAIAEGRVYDLESERAAADPFSWRQEMLLEWLDGAATYFSQELIASCEDSRASKLGHNYGRGRCFIGNDIGLRSDRWVAYVLECSDDFAVVYEDRPNGQKVSYYVGELITREIVMLDRSSFAEHDRQIARLMLKYDVMRLCIDQTSIGERSTEEYQRLYGNIIEGVIFSVDVKGDLARLGLELMTERRVLLPQDCPEVGLDFRKLQRVVSAGGAVRFQSARDAAGHSDICMAFLLACNAAVTPVQEIAYDDGGLKQSWEELGSFVY